MKYRVTIEGREREVDVRISPSGSVSVVLDGAELDTEIRPIPGGLGLRLGDRIHEVLVSGPPDELQLASGPARAIAQVVSERAAAGRKRVGASAKRELRAPMPGRVVRVLCAAGDAVVAGQALVVVEAMKMENELRAAGNATVETVHVTEGASVEGRTLLVTFAV